MANYIWNHFRNLENRMEESLRILAENSDPVLHVKPILTEKMEIAFYNVIDHRCDRAEEMNAPKESICKNITQYTEKFIAGHVMPLSKAKELRTFTKTIVSIISNPPKWLIK